MRTLKIFFSLLILMFFNMGFAFSDITQSAPTNLISTIATATSFTSLEQISPEAATEIQNTTSSIVDSDALEAEVQESAEAFGEMVSEVALEGEVKKEKFAVIGGKKNEYEGERNLEPTIGTIIYDTGLQTLTREGGNYDLDNKAPDGVTERTIFAGTQKARVKVFLDFNRKVFFGFVESEISLTDGSKMSNTYDGASAELNSEENSLPVDKRLTHTISSSTGKALDPDGVIGVTGDGEPFDNVKQDEFINSLLTVDGDIAPYLPEAEGGAPDDDLQDMVKSVSHGSGGDKNVIVQTRFITAGTDGTPGKTVVSFEAYNGDPCSGICNTAAEQTAFKDGIERYSKTVTTTATKFTGELPQ